MQSTRAIGGKVKNFVTGEGYLDSFGTRGRALIPANREAAYVTATISKKEISSTVTFKVVNGSWDDGTSKDQTVTLINQVPTRS